MEFSARLADATLSRRYFLGAALTITAAALTGCGEDSDATGTAADSERINRAATTAATLIAMETGGKTATAPSTPAIAPTLVRPLQTVYAGNHAAHLRALGRDGHTAATRTSGNRETLGISDDIPASGASAIVRAEEKGATQALTDAADANPDLAVLLTQIAVCRAVHSGLMAATGLVAKRSSDFPIPPGFRAPVALRNGQQQVDMKPGAISSLGVEAISQVVAAEHAAYYAYGVITARAPADADARLAWNAHRVLRDRYTALLEAAGGTTPAAKPAYDLGKATPETLLARVERTTVSAMCAAVANTPPAVRTLLGLDAIAAARRATSRDHRLPSLVG